MERKQTRGQMSASISSIHKILSIPPGSIEDKFCGSGGRLWEMPLLFISSNLLLKYSSFAMLCYFLLYSIIPLYICIHSFSLWFITGY